MATFTSGMSKVLLSLATLAILAHTSLNVCYPGVSVKPSGSGRYVYKFSSHYDVFPGICTSKVAATCLPPGTATTQSAGRLGNIILEYVSLWATATIYNLTAFVPDEMYARLSQVFSSLSISSEENFKKSNSNNCTDEKYNLVFTFLSQINQEKESLEQTVERSLRYWKPIVLQKCVILVEAIVPLVADIKRTFIYKDEYRDVAHEILANVRARIIDSRPEIKEVLFIGVHVRRTDYLDQLFLLYHSRRPADEGYYGRAIQRLRSLVLPPGGGAETAQIVTSDDPEWVRSTLLPHLTSLGLRHTVFAGNGNASLPEHDLALLSYCNHSVFAYGTYGMWTALWAGGRTVVYDLDQGDAVSPAMQFAWNLPHWEALK